MRQTLLVFLILFLPTFGKATDIPGESATVISAGMKNSFPQLQLQTQNGASWVLVQSKDARFSVGEVVVVTNRGENGTLTIKRKTDSVDLSAVELKSSDSPVQSFTRIVSGLFSRSKKPDGTEPNVAELDKKSPAEGSAKKGEFGRLLTSIAESLSPKERKLKDLIQSGKLQEANVYVASNIDSLVHGDEISSGVKLLIEQVNGQFSAQLTSARRTLVDLLGDLSEAHLHEPQRVLDNARAVITAYRQYSMLSDPRLARYADPNADALDNDIEKAAANISKAQSRIAEMQMLEQKRALEGVAAKLDDLRSRDIQSPEWPNIKKLLDDADQAIKRNTDPASSSLLNTARSKLLYKLDGETKAKALEFNHVSGKSFWHEYPVRPSRSLWDEIFPTLAQTLKGRSAEEVQRFTLAYADALSDSQRREVRQILQSKVIVEPDFRLAGTCKVARYMPLVADDVEATWAGECADGYADGQGTLQISSNDKAKLRFSSVSGWMKKGQWTGRIEYRSADSPAKASLSLRDGRCIMGEQADVTYPNGNRYQGMVNENCRQHGHGTLTYSPGAKWRTLSGEFSDNEIHEARVLTSAGENIVVRWNSDAKRWDIVGNLTQDDRIRQANAAKQLRQTDQSPQQPPSAQGQSRDKNPQGDAKTSLVDAGGCLVSSFFKSPVWRGQCVDGKAHGTGTLTFSIVDGSSTATGRMDQGFPIGRWNVQNTSGNIRRFDAEIANLTTVAGSHAVLEYADGTIYKGTVGQFFTKNGLGTFRWPSANSPEDLIEVSGDFKNDDFPQTGQAILRNGDQVQVTKDRAGWKVTRNFTDDRRRQEKSASSSDLGERLGNIIGQGIAANAARQQANKDARAQAQLAQANAAAEQSRLQQQAFLRQQRQLEEELIARKQAKASAAEAGERAAAARAQAAAEDSAADAAIATNCLRLVFDPNEGNQLMNTCQKTVNFVFCGVRADPTEIVGVCGRDIGGSRIGPGQAHTLTQAKYRTRFYYFACTAPFFPFESVFTADGIRSRCYR